MVELQTLRPMSTSQVLDRTFSLYRRNFLLFAGIATLPPAMILVGQSLMLGGTALAPRLANGSLSSIVAVVLGVAVFAVLYLLDSALATGATVHAVSRVHLGSPVTISAAYKAVGPIMWRTLGINILVGLMAGGAFVIGYAAVIPFFLLPTIAPSSRLLVGIIAGLASFAALVAAAVWAIRIYCRYSLAVPACVVERLPVMISLRRSKFLSQGSLGRIFLAFLLLLILVIAFSLVLSIPNYLELAFHPGKPSLPFEIWNLLSSFLAGTLSQPVAAIAVALIYFDQRVRKEAFDLQLMMEAIGGQAPPPAAAAASPNLG